MNILKTLKSGLRHGYDFMAKTARKSFATMNSFRKPLRRTLNLKRLSNSTGAIAGLVSAISVIVGVLAARAAPKGAYKLAVALHFSKTPLIVKLAPAIAGLAVTVATAAGLLKFMAWCVEREEEEAANDVEAVIDGDTE